MSLLRYVTYVGMYSKTGLTMYLPGKVVWRSFKWLPHNFATGDKGLSVQKNISTLFRSLAANSTVLSQQLMKAVSIHVLRTILHFRWQGQTVLRIHLSHGKYANSKVNFSHCASSQFSYAFFFLFLLYCMECRVYCLLSSFCQCQFNLTVAKTIKSYLILFLPRC